MTLFFVIYESITDELEGEYDQWFFDEQLVVGRRRDLYLSAEVGMTMRTDRYRYIEWITRANRVLIGRELYDHATDPDENVNVADRAEHAALIKQLSAQMQAGWQGALP